MTTGTKRFYEEHPKTCAADDYWGQVKRTVNGKPVSEEQIQLIVDTVERELDLQQEDTLLDLCCGNGALSRLLFARCSGGLGVDFSETLIKIAQQIFTVAPAQTYECGDVVSFIKSEAAPERFSKALCYAAFSLLPNDAAAMLLGVLRERFINVRTFFIGNLPDKSKVSDFFRPEAYTPGIENNPDTPLGIWRTEAEFEALAKPAGWNVRFHRMPPHYFAAKYRFDAVLTPV
jgi:SAM-dependent methyltransferase